MRRHGWALCLGAIMAGSAAAQPPTGDDRSPPAPDLPGQVVSQVPGAPSPVRPADPKEAVPAGAPLPDVLLAPVQTTPPSAQAIPTRPGGMGVPGAPTSCPPTGKAGCDIGFSEVVDWLCFRSRSRQSAHYVTPYRPPLQAWFPCEPRPAPVGLVAPPCAASPTGPVPVRLPLPAPTPVGPNKSEPPLAGGTAVGKCMDAEVLTSFQPVAPGLGFVSGAAPLANPTSQVKPTSFKPK